MRMQNELLTMLVKEIPKVRAAELIPQAMEGVKDGVDKLLELNGVTVAESERTEVKPMTVDEYMELVRSHNCYEDDVKALRERGLIV